MFDQKKTKIRRIESIRTRLSIAFILIVLLPMAIISAVLAISGSEGARSQLAGELKMASSYKELAIRTWAESLSAELNEALLGETALRYITATANTRHDDTRHAQDYKQLTDRLNQTIKSARHFDAAFIVSRSGTVIVSTDPKLRPEDFGGREFFRQGLLQPGTHIVLSEKAAIVVSVPVKDSRGMVAGSLAGRVNTSALEKIMNIRTGLGKTGKSYLVTRDGRLITPIADRQQGAIITSKGLESLMKTGKSLTGAFVDYRGVPVIGTYLWMPDLGMVLVTEQDQEESANVLLVILAVNASIALTAVFIAAFAAMGITRSISNPLSELAKTSGEIAEGNLGLRARVERQDEIGMLASSFNNMTDQLKMTLEVLRQSEEKYRGIFEKALEGIFQSTLDGRFISVNPAMARILGFDNERQLIAEYNDLSSQLYVNPDERISLVEDLMKYGQVLGREVQGYRRDKKIIWLSISATLVRDEDGAPLYIEGMNADISDRKNAEEAIRSLNEELEQRVYDRTRQLASANKDLQQLTGRLESAYDELKAAQSRILQQEKMASIGQLAAGVAHEINNPIGFIMSNLNSLSKYIEKITEFVEQLSEKIGQTAAKYPEHAAELRGYLDEKRESVKLDYMLADLKDIISESLDGAQRVKRIVQDLKSFARLDETDTKMADINEGIESTIAIAWNEIKYRAKLEKDFGDIPLTRCNPGQLNQVFMNMLVNAAQAITEHGVIKVKTWSENELINISISDTGSGIPEDKLSRIFEPFYTTKEVGKGTGLGLSIAYDIIKKHNGTIHVESETGKGTTFIVSLPVIRE